MNCADHKEMHADIIETKTIVGGLQDNVKDLYDKRDELGASITTLQTKVMAKLADLEVHFITEVGAKDRRSLDKIKRGAKFACKIFIYTAAGVLGGGSVYVAMAAAVAKFLK